MVAHRLQTGGPGVEVLINGVLMRGLNWYGYGWLEGQCGAFW